MMLAEVPSATEIFIDANIFVYHFSGPTELTPACSTFLRRIEDHDLAGLTSLTVVAEVLHRLMIIEATETLHVEARQVVRYLRHVATNDPDFERVGSLKVWKPSPLAPSA